MAELRNGLSIDPVAWSFLDRTDDYVLHFEAANPGRRLLALPARRQMRTAAAILQRLRTQRGILLADDVGLGKTAVAILVACVVAGAVGRSDAMKVRILAPNNLLKRKWRTELLSHIAALRSAAPRLKLDLAERSVNRGQISRLKDGQIEVTTPRQSKALDCDLLIVDEAHRARNSTSQFSRKLSRSAKGIGGVLTLTATPFSVDVGEFTNLLSFVGADSKVRTAARSFSRHVDHLWLGRFGTDAAGFGDRLASAGEAAVAAMKPFVMRVGVDDLPPEEQAAFGHCTEWRIPVTGATADEAQLLCTAVRVLDLAKDLNAWSHTRLNDPRFHAGWFHLRHVLNQVSSAISAEIGSSTDGIVLTRLLERAKGHLDQVEPRGHSKMRQVASAVRDVVRQGEKALLFCHHHSTAAELAVLLHNEIGLPAVTESNVGWEQAWRLALNNRLDGQFRTRFQVGKLEMLLDSFVRWLTSPTVRGQVSEWLGGIVPPDAQSLEDRLSSSKPRPSTGHDDPPIADAAASLFHRIVESPSARKVLEAGPHAMPGGSLPTRVIGRCDTTAWAATRSVPQGLIGEHTSDAVLAVFNSPFGPDVLVATDALSEGVDLHGCCRYLVHYELNPSPLSAVQRNGRLRRIDCWAARTRKPLCVAWPRFTGTRDERLVQIVQERLEQFSLLLGGIRAEVNPEAPTDVERAKATALARARKRLENLSLSPFEEQLSSEK